MTIKNVIERFPENWHIIVEDNDGKAYDGSVKNLETEKYLSKEVLSILPEMKMIPRDNILSMKINTISEEHDDPTVLVSGEMYWVHVKMKVEDIFEPISVMTQAKYIDESDMNVVYGLECVEIIDMFEVYDNRLIMCVE